MHHDVTSRAVRTSRIEQPVAAARPVISRRAGRGRAGSRCTARSPARTARRRRPSATARATARRVGRADARVASAESPTTNALAIVPMPGLSRSGIQSSSTTKLITITAWPIVIGTCWSDRSAARPRAPARGRRGPSARARRRRAPARRRAAGAGAPGGRPAAGRRAEVGRGRERGGPGRAVLVTAPFCRELALSQIANRETVACMDRVRHRARAYATLVGDFDRSPAYAGLADALRS